MNWWYDISEEARQKEIEILKEKQRAADWLTKLSDEIDNRLESESIPTNEIIAETPPLPELNVSKFGMERGNDEIALWLKQGKESGHLTETIIGIALIHYRCPFYETEDCPCSYESPDDSFRELFTHFKNTHYNGTDLDAVARHALYERVTRDIPEHYTSEERRLALIHARNPSKFELDMQIKIVKESRAWQDMAYAMLQDCFVFEANSNPEHRRGAKAKYDKRAAVCYRMQKVHGLTTPQISKIFFGERDGVNNGIRNLTEMRRIITDGMMVEHGNKEENLPTWMQNALKQK